MAELPLVRVRLKYGDAETFLSRFAPNVTRGGIFLASRDPRPVGALIRFEVSLVTGQRMLGGEGRVTWVKPFNAAEPTKPHGMGVQFTELEPSERATLERLLERREAAGRRVAPPPIPALARPPERRIAPEPTPAVDFEGASDTVLRRALDRARVLASKDDDLEQLLRPEATPTDPPLAAGQPAEELTRYLSSRRGSGWVRLTSESPTPSNGTSGEHGQGDRGSTPAEATEDPSR